MLRSHYFLPLLLVLAGCPEENSTTSNPPVSPKPVDPTVDGGGASSEDAGKTLEDAGALAVPATHTGLVSIQDISIANLPQAGHGLTVNAFLTPLVVPDFAEPAPDGISGCRAWSYDLANGKPPPPEEDHGELRIDGIKNGALSCRFVPQRGYVCPTGSSGATARAVEVRTTAGAPVANLVIDGGAFAATDVGRYLSLSGATSAPNNGAFAIVGVVSATEVVVSNPRAAAETFQGTYTVLAGAGPTPNDLYDPFTANTPVNVQLVPNATAKFQIDPGVASISPALDFTLDDASKARIMNIPVSGEAITLGCASATCGTAQGTVVRITATDADVTNASPVAMPAPKRKLVEIQCLRIGADAASQQVAVPAAAMNLIRDAHAVSPITRIRTAYMRDSFAIATAKAPNPPNIAYVLAGHGVLGFTKPL